ncbi:hypothetical protein Lgee_1621 [Legionella geestiana]|uniref:Uncharacterized protein n=1 Tax=Legionella geestiana TaxID=45065 RepID=A0A0W0TRT6_9GAMM|nr:hypothetical protein [Legionella geestiana]KTC98319.1 hypothetical protein Lgee_1621 [Legionella geestiana]QBS11366.1 hypothetical protein E4T54_00655 [Legionella geestiana]QDQ38918.1 hypothetical protein E3226_000125 [Legionella geestiana]STX53980.1 Uncharacterised protein [Legionella geestiana]
MKRTMIIAGMLLTGSISAFAKPTQPFVHQPNATETVKLQPVSAQKPCKSWEDTRFDTLYERIAKTLEGNQRPPRLSP